MELWQSKATPDVSNALSKEEKDRQETVFELILTETKYAELLTEIQEFYYTPFSEMVLPSELVALFAGVTNLIQVHQAFAETLRERRNDGLVVEKLGDVLLQYVRLTTHTLGCICVC